MLSTFDQCIQKAPISIVCIGKQEEIVAKYKSVENSHSLDNVNVEFVETGRHALSVALQEPEPRVVWGLIRFMKTQDWSLKRKLQLLSAYRIANIELADEITDDDLPHL